MHIIDVTERGPLLDAVYADVLVPSFDPNELESPESLGGGIVSGASRLATILDDTGAPIAAAAVDYARDSRVMLLSYLAVKSGLRGGGHGGALLRHVQHDWFAELGAVVLIAEIEHPAAHTGSTRYGDPAARVRFYARHGGRALDVAYFQPALDEDAERVYGLILAVLAVEGGTDTIDGAPIRAFMERYLAATEGTGGSDPALDALWSGLDRPGGVRLLPLDDLARIPLSTPTGPHTA